MVLFDQVLSNASGSPLNKARRFSILEHQKRSVSEDQLAAGDRVDRRIEDQGGSRWCEARGGLQKIQGLA